MSRKRKCGKKTYRKGSDAVLSAAQQMRTAEEWHDEVCIAADATHGAIVEVVRRIQAEALEEAARVCGRIANERYDDYRERRDWHDDGKAVGAEECELAIRALAERVKGGDDGSQR